MSKDIKCPECNTLLDFHDLMPDQVKNDLRKEVESEVKSRISFDIKKKYEDDFHKKNVEYLKAQTRINELELDNKRKEEISNEKVKKEIAKEVELQRVEIKTQFENSFNEEKVKTGIQNKEYLLHIDMLQKNISDLEKKSNQRSMQRQGEGGEIYIEDTLADKYKFDKVEPIAKGQKGGDCILSVRNKNSKTVGSIYFESKRTKHFSSDWIFKLKKDMREKKIEYGVIVTESFPPDIDGAYFSSGGVLICKFYVFLIIADLLREQILKVSRIEKFENSRKEIAHTVYDYFTSEEFTENIRSVLEPIEDMNLQLIKEKTFHTRKWEEREKLINNATYSINKFIGSMQSIKGNSMNLLEDIEVIKDGS